MEFREENYRGLLACTYCVDRAFKQSLRKLLLIGTKQRNSQKFSPSKVSHYMVCMATLPYLKATFYARVLFMRIMRVEHQLHKLVSH